MTNRVGSNLGELDKQQKKINTDENATKLSELMSTSSGRTGYGLFNTEETLTG